MRSYEWYVTPEYHFGEKIYAVARENPKTGNRETIGTFDKVEYAEEFAEAMNGRKSDGSD